MGIQWGEQHFSSDPAAFASHLLHIMLQLISFGGGGLLVKTKIENKFKLVRREIKILQLKLSCWEACVCIPQHGVA